MAVWEATWRCGRQRDGVGGCIVSWEATWWCGRACGGVGGNVMVLEATRRGGVVGLVVLEAT